MVDCLNYAFSVYLNIFLKYILCALKKKLIILYIFFIKNKTICEMKITNPIHVYQKYGCDYILMQIEREYITDIINEQFSFQLRIDKLLGCMDGTGRYMLPNENSTNSSLGYSGEIDYLENNPICFDTPSFELIIKNLKTDEKCEWSSEIDYTDEDVMQEFNQVLEKNNINESFVYIQNFVHNLNIPSEFLQVFYQSIRSDKLSPLNINSIELFDRKPKLEYISCGSFDAYMELFETIGNIDKDGSGVENFVY